MRDGRLIIFNLQQKQFALLSYDTEYNRNAMYTIYNATSLEEDNQYFFKQHNCDGFVDDGILYVVDFSDQIFRKSLINRNKVNVQERYLEWVRRLIEYNLKHSPAEKIALLFYEDKQYIRANEDKKSRRKRHFVFCDEKEFITALGKKEIKLNQGYIITKY